MATKTLLVIEHSVKLNGEVYKNLAAAGYVIVRGNPSQFHVLDALPIAQTGAILDAALATLRADFTYVNGDTIRSRFAKELLNRVGRSGRTGHAMSAQRDALPEAAAWRRFSRRLDRCIADPFVDTSREAMGVTSELWTRMHNRVVAYCEPNALAYPVDVRENRAACVIAALWMALEAEDESSSVVPQGEERA